MKKYTYLIILFPLLIFAQKKDLYVTFNDPSVFRISKSEDKSSILENYMLAFNQTDKPHYKLTVNEYGNIVRNVVVIGSPRGSLFFTYSNNNSQNPPIIINTKDITNVITPNEILYSFETDIMSIISHFDNVYLVDMSVKNQNNYLAKKISITKNPGM